MALSSLRNLPVAEIISALHKYPDYPLDVPWLKWPNTQRLLALFAKHGIEVRFVGGCVRDALLGVSAIDIDIAVHAPMEELNRVLAQDWIVDTKQGNPDFGLISIEVDGNKFDILSTFVRLAAVADIVPAEQFLDYYLYTGDFTINAVALGPDGTLYSYGSALEDIRAGRIDFIKDSAQSIIDSPNRIIRFFRFQAAYGKVPSDPDLLQIIKAQLPQLDNVLPFMLQLELNKCFKADEPYAVLQPMAELGVLQYVFGFEVFGCEPLLQLQRIEVMLEKKTPPSVRLLLVILQADLLPERALTRISDLLDFSVDNRAVLQALLEAVSELESDSPAETIAALQEKLGPAFASSVLVRWALEEDVEATAPAYRAMLVRGKA